MIKLMQLIKELQVNNPNVSINDVWDYYKDVINAIRDQNSWNEWNIIRSYYEDKYGIMSMCLWSEFAQAQLSQSDLNKLYRELKQLAKKIP